MTLRLWHPLDELDLLVGASFPHADEDMLRRCAQAWAAAAQELSELAPLARDAGAGALTLLGGEPGAAFARLWSGFSAGDSGLIDVLARHCAGLAQACEKAATEVEYAKLEYLLALTLLAVTIAALLAMVWAGGVSATGIPAAVAATHITVRLILTRLLTAIVVGSLVNGGVDALAQGIQMAAGHRDSWDWGQTTRAMQDGAVFGAAGGGVFLGAARLAPGALRSAAGLLGAGAVTGGVGGVATSLVHGELPTTRQFLLAVTSGLAGGAGPDLVQPRLAGAAHLGAPELPAAALAAPPSTVAGLDVSLSRPDHAAAAAHLAIAHPTEPSPTGLSPTVPPPTGLSPTVPPPTVPPPTDGDVAAPHTGEDAPMPLYPLGDAEAKELVRANAFHTNAGMAFYPPGDPIRQFAHAIRPTDGFVTLDLHGSPDGFLVDGELLGPRQFAGAVRDLLSNGMLRLPDGDGIKLLSCDTAVGGAVSPAAVMSSELGVAVVAPDQPVWTSLDGAEFVASPVLVDGIWQPAVPPDGAWWRFDPTGEPVRWLP